MRFLYPVFAAAAIWSGCSSEPKNLTDEEKANLKKAVTVFTDAGGPPDPTDENIDLAQKVEKMDHGALMRYLSDCDIKKFSCVLDIKEDDPIAKSYAELTDDEKKAFRDRTSKIMFHKIQKETHEFLSHKDEVFKKYNKALASKSGGSSSVPGPAGGFSGQSHLTIL